MNLFPNAILAYILLLKNIAKKLFLQKLNKVLLRANIIFKFIQIIQYVISQTSQN